MKTPNRKLLKKKDVLTFLDQLDVLDYVESLDDSFADSMKAFLIKKNIKCNYEDTELMIMKISEVLAKLHTEIEKYGPSGNTLENESLRNEKYRNNISRKKLYKDIVTNCLSNSILEDDDKVDFYNGGIAPSSCMPKAESKMFLLIGCPASGKSSYAHKIVEEYGAYLVDSDIFKRKFPEYKNSENSANFLHKESQQIKSEILKKILPSKKNVVIPTIGKNYSELRDLIKRYTDLGYVISIILFDVKKDQAVLRALKRYLETGRYISLSYVFDTCGNEAVASFYRIAAEDRERSMVAIDNNTNKERKGKLEFSQNADDIINIFNDKIIVG